jgi:modulator of FtsH protease HflK
VYGNVSKVMVDSRNGSNLLYLPLDKLMQQSGVAPAAAAAPVESAPVNAGSVDVRARDPQRSRERESR